MRFCAEKLQLRFIKIRVSWVAICDSIFDFSAPVTNSATPINFWDITNLHLCLENFEICKVYVIFLWKMKWNHVRVKKSSEELCVYDGEIDVWLISWNKHIAVGTAAVQTSVGHLRAAQRVKRERQQRERERDCSYFLLGNAMARGVLCNRRSGEWVGYGYYLAQSCLDYISASASVLLHSLHPFLSLLLLHPPSPLSCLTKSPPAPYYL